MKSLAQKLFIFYLPLVLTTLALLLFLSRASSNFVASDSGQILSNIVFFNQTHVLLTFFLLFGVEHYGGWRANFKRLNLGFNRHLILVFSLFFILTQAVYFDCLGIGKERGIFLFLIFTGIYGTQHLLFQSFGFSKYLNSGYRLEAQPAENILRTLSEQTKAELFYLKILFLAFTAITFAVFFLRKSGFKQFYFPVLALIGFFAIYALIGILISLLRLPKLLRNKKMLFCSRYALYPFKALSPWLGITSTAIHAWEYIFFANHSFMQENAQKSFGARKFTLFLICEVIFIVPLIFINSKILKREFALSGSWEFAVIKGLVHSTILSHFYLDRLAYAKKSNAHSHELLKFDKIAADLYRMT